MPLILLKIGKDKHLKKLMQTMKLVTIAKTKEKKQKKKPQDLQPNKLQQ